MKHGKTGGDTRNSNWNTKGNKKQIGWNRKLKIIYEGKRNIIIKGYRNNWKDKNHGIKGNYRDSRPIGMNKLKH